MWRRASQYVVFGGVISEKNIDTVVGLFVDL
jgi:hypothetical protein